LPDDKVLLVRVTPEVARATVLASQRDSGSPADVASLRDGDCVFVAWLQDYPMSMAPVPPPPSAVYLVRLIPTAASRGSETWVMVDATTGELGSATGMPNLGSQCEVGAPSA
jgi:hypothetical protein